MSRRVLLGVLICALIGAGVYLLTHYSRSEHGSEGTGETSSTSTHLISKIEEMKQAKTAHIRPQAQEPEPMVAAALPVVVEPTVPILRASTGPLQPVTLPVATVMENVRSVVRRYGHMYGGNPVGQNVEITRALNGGNQRRVRFLQEDAGMRLNEAGELVDSWGTPFFFHQLAALRTEIRSAGPDKTMWTADDLLAHP